MDTSALAVVLNECNSHLINQANTKLKIEKIVDGIFDELTDFIQDVNFYNDTKYEIEIWRNLLEIKHDDELKLRIERYDKLHIQLADFHRHISDYDSQDDTTTLIQATNAIYLLKYRKEIVDDLMKNIKRKRTTKCCGKILNDYKIKDHKHYSFHNIIADRNEDMKHNACKTCRPVWNAYEPLYNCEICHLKWRLFYRCFYQYLCRSADVVADTQLKRNGFYNNYTEEQLRNAGLDNRTIERSYSHLKTIYDAGGSDHIYNEHECFNYYTDYGCKCNSYEECNGECYAEEEYDDALDRKLEDVIE